MKMIGRHSYVIEPLHLLSYDSRKADGSEGAVVIGSFCSIAHNCTFILSQHNHKWVTTSYTPKMRWSHRQGNTSSFCRGDIVIGNDVWIGANVTILDNVTIGHGAVISAGSVVTKSIPPYAVVGGNPARPIKYRFSPEQIANLLSIEWWNLDDEALEHLNLYDEDIDAFTERCRRFKAGNYPCLGSAASKACSNRATSAKEELSLPSLP